MLDRDLQRELIDMIERDQIARRRYLTNPADDVLAREVAAIDRDHRTRIAAIIKSVGWPGRSLVDDDGSTAAFGLVAHAHDSLWDEALPLLRDAVEREDADPSHYARLLDRSLKAKGRPQEYGTRVDVVDDDVVVPTVRDHKTLDARRAAVGLPPLEEQRREVRARMFPQGRAHTRVMSRHAP